MSTVEILREESRSSSSLCSDVSSSSCCCSLLLHCGKNLLPKKHSCESNCGLLRVNFSGILVSFKCVEADEKCMCNLQNEGSSERSRASERVQSEKILRKIARKLGKKQKVVPQGVETFVNWLLPVSVTGCKLQLKVVSEVW